MNQRFSPKMLSLTWNHLGDDDNSQSSWLFRFHSEDNFGSALQTFTQCLWESLHQTPWGKIKPDEQNYVIRSNEDVEMMDVENEAADEDEVASELDPDEESSEESEDEDEDAPQPTPGDRNSQLTVHTSFAETTSECSIILLIIQSSTMRQ